MGKLKRRNEFKKHIFIPLINGVYVDCLVRKNVVKIGYGRIKDNKLISSNSILFPYPMDINFAELLACLYVKDKFPLDRVFVDNEWAAKQGTCTWISRDFNMLADNLCRKPSQCILTLEDVIDIFDKSPDLRKLLYDKVSTTFYRRENECQLINKS